jgi:hypothetical protein
MDTPEQWKARVLDHHKIGPGFKSTIERSFNSRGWITAYGSEAVLEAKITIEPLASTNGPHWPRG